MRIQYTAMEGQRLFGQITLNKTQVNKLAKIQVEGNWKVRQHTVVFEGLLKYQVDEILKSIGVQK